MKQVIVTFNFDPETELVSDVKCSVDGVEKKKKTTKTTKNVVVKLEDEALIELEANKLVFNNRAISDLNLNPGDRIIIKWIPEGKKMVPIIGTDIAFDEEGSGNKVTKSNTVTYKGNANTILGEYGVEFSLKPHSDNIWRLVPLKIGGTISKPTEELDTVIKQAESVEPELLTELDNNIEIDELTFQL